jgi:hypothetical protein
VVAVAGAVRVRVRVRSWEFDTRHPHPHSFVGFAGFVESDLGYGLWVMGYGLWVMGSGLWDLGWMGELGMAWHVGIIESNRIERQAMI